MTAIVDDILRKVGLRRLSEADRLKPMPFGKAPRGSREVYLERFEEARQRVYPSVDAIEETTGHRIDRAFLDDLALHTQIVLKKNPLNFSHGRILYSFLRAYLDALDPSEHVTILETGTARGFSSICMARALADHGRTGSIVTIDILPHQRPIYWNCIDDHERMKTRTELLEPWRAYLKNIMFLTADSNDALSALHLDRVHFSFLDGAHTREDVLAEHAYVEARQRPGDVIVYDDVSEQFEGVRAAVEAIAAGDAYAVERLEITDIYGVAKAVKR